MQCPAGWQVRSRVIDSTQRLFGRTQRFDKRRYIRQLIRNADQIFAALDDALGQEAVQANDPALAVATGETQVGLTGGAGFAFATRATNGGDDEVTWLSLRNVAEVHLIAADQLNTYDVLVNDDVVFTSEALDEFLGRSGESQEEDA